MRSLFRSFTLSTVLFAALFVSAQVCPFGPVDISLVQNQDAQLEVWLTPQVNFDENLSSVLFTVRWLNDDEVSLGSISMEPPFLGLSPAGPEQVDGIYRYQRFSSEVSNLLYNAPEEFIAGEEILYARIAILNGNSYFEITMDDWAGDNNGLYYVSLNGYDCTGEVISISTYVPEGPPMSGLFISPNPTTGISTVNIMLTEKSDLKLELYDPAGRRIWQQDRAGRVGQHVEQLDMQHLADGVYLLQVRIGDRISTHRVVLGGGRD